VGNARKKGKLALTDEKSDTDTRHVEAVKPGLDIEPDVLCVAQAFPFKDALCDGGDGGIVAGLDCLEDLGPGEARQRCRC
jgi:hypothetical protein